MTTIALDIQPQYRFSCLAANDKRFLQQPEKIVNELNTQAALADFRVLVENVTALEDAPCGGSGTLNRSGLNFQRSNYFSDCFNGCRSTHLLKGLPCPADYDNSIEIYGNHRHGTCFHDAGETKSTGLIEWLYKHKADTVIIGGLATEEAVANTAKQLFWYSNDLHIIVNLAACCGYAPESTIRTIYNLREMGISVVTDSSQIQTQMNLFASRSLFKVS